jgi:hypothetical protein
MQFLRYGYVAKRRQKTMKVTTLTNIVLLAIASAGIGLAPSARADHATNFLDTLQADLATRQDDTNNTPAQNHALSAASKALNRNTKTLSADLSAFASAANTLNAAFTDDALLTLEEEQVLLAYSTEAQAQIDALSLLADTNGFPKSIANQLSQAQDAVARGNDSSNSVPTRAKALAFAFNKIRVATQQILHKYKAPLAIGNGQTITLSGRSFQVTLNGDGSYTIGDPSSPDESGTWTYDRTGPNSATVELSGGESADLKFTSPSGGTFSGSTGTDNVRGKFTVSSE